MTFKQTLKHLADILSGTNRNKMLENLERDIEEQYDKAQLYNMDDSFNERMKPVHRMQADYMQMTGKYHPYGTYKFNRGKNGH